MKEAVLYEKHENRSVRCALCSHRCLIQNGDRGICAVRENRSGVLFSLVYGKLIASHCDPIEKKPFFHFLPGSRSHSIATAGCNLRCLFCQNADISQLPRDHHRIAGDDRGPEQIVRDALANRSQSIAYTYTEPTIYFELALDTARLAVQHGLRNVFVTNGYMTAECLATIGADLHAANVDLKAFRDSFYREQCGAKLAPVLQTLEAMKHNGVWLEVTTLLIPGLNDSPAELGEIAAFLADLDPSIPWHISRFHPTYRLNHLPPTSAESVRRAREIGHAAGLRYVYSGNLPGDMGENTFCHGCGERLIDRVGFAVARNELRGGCCPHCHVAVPGVWEG